MFTLVDLVYEIIGYTHQMEVQYKSVIAFIAWARNGPGLGDFWTKILSRRMERVISKLMWPSMESMYRIGQKSMS